jgi:hypothetical protein
MMRSCAVVLGHPGAALMRTTPISLFSPSSACPLTTTTDNVDVDQLVRAFISSDGYGRSNADRQQWRQRRLKRRRLRPSEHTLLYVNSPALFAAFLTFPSSVYTFLGNISSSNTTLLCLTKLNSHPRTFALHLSLDYPALLPHPTTNSSHDRRRNMDRPSKPP